MEISKEKFLEGKLAIKIELHLEKEICKLLCIANTLSESIEVNDGHYVYVKKGLWCDNINVVPIESLPNGIKPINFYELENMITHEEIIL